MRRAIAVVMLVAGGLTVMGAWPMGSNYNGRSFMSAGGPALRTLRIGIVTAVALAAALVATMALAPRAEAFVYSIERNNMVRANNDGSDVQPTLIAPAITGVGSGGCVCLEAYNGYLYWSDPQRNFIISRARIDGTDVNYNFIDPGIRGVMMGLAVNGAGIYWSDSSGSGDRIGRADLDGGNVNPDFIVVNVGPSATSMNQMTANESHIYWSLQNYPDYPGVSIGRANSDGTGVDHTLVELQNSGPNASSIGDLALSNTHVYWNDQGPGPGRFGRATLDGGDVNPSFVPKNAEGAVDTGLIAIEGDYLYFNNYRVFPESVGRMNLDGTNINPFFIPSPTESTSLAIAVDSLTSESADCDAEKKAVKKAKNKVKKADTPEAKKKAKKKLKKAKKKLKKCQAGSQ